MKLEPEESLNIIQTHPVSVVTTVNKEKVPNAATFSWICPVSNDPPMVSVMVSPDRYTYNNLANNKSFVINVITKHSLDETMYVGSTSFKEEPDKIENSNFSTKKSDTVDPPRLTEAIAWIECSVEGIWETGDHCIAVGKIKAGEVLDEFWDKRLLVEEAETVHHLMDDKFVVAGEVIDLKV